MLNAHFEELSGGGWRGASLLLMHVQGPGAGQRGGRRAREAGGWQKEQVFWPGKDLDWSRGPTQLKGGRTSLGAESQGVR